jgi:formyl-CoA transferase
MSSIPNATPPARALEGIRVLDLSRVLAGPWCTQNLADLGAEVIKVERPGAGDDTRSWGPPFLKDRQGKDTADSAYYLAANRNKKSITLDLSSAAGQQAARDLARVSDIVVENYKVGDMARYGLDYESLRAINPRLIYCSITGFGQTGPWAHRPGYDFIIQGIGGMMSVTGEADDRPGGGPQKVGVAVVDLSTGMYATQAILAALFHRERTGQGQSIDVALLDVQVAMLANMATNYLHGGKPPRRWGNAHPNVVPYQTFRTSDGWIIVATGNDEQFRRMCAAGGEPELGTDERFARMQDRIRNREALLERLVAMVQRNTRAYWLEALEKAGVPCGPINDIAQTFDNPQVRARSMQIAIEREDTGAVALVRNPVRYSATPVRNELAPPRLGQHNEEVLGQLLGYEPGQIQAATGGRTT